MDVDAVKKRSANLIHITLYLSRSTHTTMRGVAIIATWTRVHRSYKHERAWIFYGILGSGNGYLAVFKGLTKNFES